MYLITGLNMGLYINYVDSRGQGEGVSQMTILLDKPYFLSKNDHEVGGRSIIPKNMTVVYE